MFPLLENLEREAEYLQNSNSILIGNNLQDTPSHMNCSRTRHRLVSSFLWNRPILHRVNVSITWKPEMQAVFLWKTNSIVTKIQDARHSSFCNTWLSSRTFSCFFIAPVESYLEQNEYFSPWEPWETGNNPFQTNSIFTGKQYARDSCFYHTWFSSKKYTCFFNSAA